MTPTILIVDDEEFLREAIAFDFRRKKFNVFLAASGREALAIVEREKIDVVLSDVRMPNGDGLELLEEIKNRNAALPVVMFITGFADLTLDEAYHRGADAVFAKPFDRKILMAAVERSVRRTEERLAREPSPGGFRDQRFGLRSLRNGADYSAQVKSIGRGGMFLQLSGGPIPSVQEEVDFRFHIPSAGGRQVSGCGIVRWIRKETETGPVGIGIEFVALDRDCLPPLFEIIDPEKTRPFIPNV